MVAGLRADGVEAFPRVFGRIILTVVIVSTETRLLLSVHTL